MTDVLLFQAQVVLSEVDKKVMFLKSKIWELSDGTGRALDAVVGESGKCFPVHHK